MSSHSQNNLDASTRYEQAAPIESKKEEDSANFTSAKERQAQATDKAPSPELVGAPSDIPAGVMQDGLNQVASDAGANAEASQAIEASEAAQLSAKKSMPSQKS